ncbi:MAG TPA: signal recognition particle protein, partial [Candidatus Handelsmanbacteria bacterium]|nr:signal recognition particle protein [Candidatus Handelsmanbacteria bacterium]
MFEGITDGLKGALSFIERSRLTEGNIREGLGQVRQALLEADVHFDVANAFVERVTEQALGERVLKSIRPSEQIVGIVHQELVELMGPVDASLPIRRDGLAVIMLCGLQGSGKTTTCGKLARLLKQQGHLPMLVAADLQRPAAIEQLQVIADQIDVPCYTETADSSPLAVCRNGLKQAKANPEIRVVILDTAGRLHVDDELMSELEDIDRKIQPHQVLLVCDAMTGQDAVNSAKAFNDALEVDGVILTKLDGDTRGGAALSVKAVTGVPIKYIGVGETPEDFAVFFLGLFMVVGGVEHSEFLVYIGQFILPYAQNDLMMATVVLMWVAAFLSAAIDNIPFTAAMIPIILGMEVPEELFSLTNPLVVGLIKETGSLVQIRRNRLRMLNEGDTSEYADPDAVAEEVKFANRIIAGPGWPVIDVTRRSIAETAASIMPLLTEARQNSNNSEAEYKSFMDDLLSFDGALDQSSTSAIKYIYWREALRLHFTSENLPALIDLVKGESSISVQFSDIFVTATEEAFTKLKLAPKGLDRVYGDEYRTQGL